MRVFVAGVTEALAGVEGDDVLALPLDVTRPEQIEPALDAALERFGRIDSWSTTPGSGSSVRQRR